MPWTGPQFQHHNKGLTPAHAAHAASVANAILRRTGDEGLAIATANAREPHRAAGGMLPTMMPAQHMGHLGVTPAHAMTGFHPMSLRPHRDDGGAIQPTPGLQPNISTANPMQQGYIQRFAAMSPEQLQELVVRLGGSPLAAIAQRVLQQKRMMPAPTPVQVQAPQTQTPLQPAQPAQAQPAQMQPQDQGQPVQQAARGGGMQPKENTVPILAAGGEFIVSPHHVARMGGGSVKDGHRALDKFVVERRKEIINTMKGLRPPVGSKLK